MKIKKIKNPTFPTSAKKPWLFELTGPKASNTQVFLHVSPPPVIIFPLPTALSLGRNGRRLRRRGSGPVSGIAPEARRAAERPSLWLVK